MQIHPRPNYKEDPVKIINPSKSSPLSTFDDPNEIVIIVPDGETPKTLNSIELKSWTNAPTHTAEWFGVYGQANFNEPPMQKVAGKKLSAGVITVEADGRIWAVAPTNQFGGYKVTFPKGTIEQGMNAQATAIREAYEESGLQVELTGFIGDFERTTSVTRYYFARRVDGNPADMGWESQAVLLIPKEKLLALLDHPKDKPLIATVLTNLASI